ncbi:MAG TPA: energy-coupling factor transporter ATPase [Anaerolineae bacterium]|nr:energy-coupling factor transporter ATPase [Anaerolineae bacterium]
MMADPIIRLDGVSFGYNAGSPDPHLALRDINLQIWPGDYVVIVGHNGSGKSTLAKLLNALLQPTVGDVWVEEMNTRNQRQIPAIRSTVGMVFQVPDNQIVATVVEEDVAFGPENLGVPRAEIRLRVDAALDAVGLTEKRQRPPHLLSAGEKQRVAIAGVIAMRPRVMVLDEATAYLDPQGRSQVLDVIRQLNRSGMTVVAITHFMHEAVEGNRVLVMEKSRIVLEGTPRDVFGQVERLRELQLDVPQPTDLAYRLHQRWSGFPEGLLTVPEVVEETVKLWQRMRPA